MVRKMPGGYIPEFPECKSKDPLMERLKQAHATIVAIRREFVERKGSGSASLLAETLSERLKRECLPSVNAGRRRIAELSTAASDPQVARELDALAGERRWDGSRDPLTSPVKATDAAIQLTLDWMERESTGRRFLL